MFSTSYSSLKESHSKYYRYIRSKQSFSVNANCIKVYRVDLNVEVEYKINQIYIHIHMYQ